MLFIDVSNEYFNIIHCFTNAMDMIVLYILIHKHTQSRSKIGTLILYYEDQVFTMIQNQTSPQHYVYDSLIFLVSSHGRQIDLER